MQQVSMLLSTLAIQLPTLIVCLIGFVVVLIRWQEAPRAALWALLGFGLALMLCIVVPVVQTSVQRWVMASGDVARRAPIFGGLSILWSVLRATTYALLLAAVFAGRSPSRAGAAQPAGKNGNAWVG